MSNAYMDTSITDKAISFAVKAHQNTERRGHNTPYVLHVLEAAAITETLTTDQEIIAAAVLHDVLEDTETSYEDLVAEFGERVASLVQDESEQRIEGRSEESTWVERKQAAIDRIAAASYDAKLVAMGDKLSNMRAIYRDYLKQGPALWNIFHNNDPKMHEWHYRGLAESLNALEGTEAYSEFMWLINETFK